MKNKKQKQKKVKQSIKPLNPKIITEKITTKGVAEVQLILLNVKIPEQGFKK